MLEIAGLGPAEENVYLTLLGLPPVTVSEAYQACRGLSRDTLKSVLRDLADQGLLTELPEPPLRYAPVAPDMALEPCLAQREEELRQARAAVADLTRRYRTIPRHTAAGELAEIVTGRRRTMQRWLSSLATASSQVRALGRPPFETASPRPCPTELDLLRRGLPVRVVYDESAVAGPADLARRKADIAAGEQARITSELSVHLLLIDDQLALMPLSRSRPHRSDGLLVVYPCALLDALSALFEHIWASAVPLSFEPGPQPGEQPPVLANPTTRTILALLSAGLTDQAIARRLGCSERTIQRHILRLSQAVDAKTRFQAALRIGYRGWT